MEPFVIQSSTLPFRGEEPNFQEQLQNFEVAALKFNIDRHSTSTTSKGLSEIFFLKFSLWPFEVVEVKR